MANNTLPCCTRGTEYSMYVANVRESGRRHVRPYRDPDRDRDREFDADLGPLKKKKEGGEGTGVGKSSDNTSIDGDSPIQLDRPILSLVLLSLNSMGHSINPVDQPINRRRCCIIHIYEEYDIMGEEPSDFQAIISYRVYDTT